MTPRQQDSETARWFAEEVHPHEPMLRAWLRARFSSGNDTDDVVQEVYIRILRARDLIKLRSPKAFLFRVAGNAMRDLVRHRAVLDAVPFTETASLHVLEGDPGVVDLVSRKQELEFLAEAIQTLPERCRQVFLLRKIQGLSQREIASRLGITENTVETLVAKGIRRCADNVRERCQRHPLHRAG